MRARDPIDPQRRLALKAAGALTLGAAAPAFSQTTPDGPVRDFGFIYASAPYPQCHASTIVETRRGTIAAAWFGGTRERDPDVEIWFARRGASGWGTPVSVATGKQPDGTRLPTWNPVLFQDPAGPLLLFYKVGPNPRGWWGEVIRSSDDGLSWSAPQRLPKGILGPIKNKPVTLPDGSWLSPSSIETDSDWTVCFERSADAGRSWAAEPVAPGPGKFDAIQPSVLFLKGGELQAVARTRQGVLAATRSKDGGRSWGNLFAIDLPNPNSGTDAVTLRDGRHLIVYNHSAQSPDKVTKGLRYPINVAISNDAVQWRKVLTLESEPVADGYAYPAVIQSADGLVHITYTHNRRRIRHVVVDPRRL